MTIHNVIFLLIVAVLTAMAAQRLHVPYTVGLVLVGTVLALSHVTRMALTRQLLFDGLLPPLLFEASISLPWSQLRKNAAPILTLATAGVVISAAVVAGGMTLLAHWPWPSALVFGVLIAATDPVSVLATFKGAGVTGRLRLLVESESLFNDGVAAVLYTVAVSYAVSASGSSVGLGVMATSLIWEVIGGIVIGALCGLLAVRLAGRPTADHMVETALTAAAAYGSFLLAEDLHSSGVLATLSAGLVIGNYGSLNNNSSRFFSDRGLEVAEAFWEFAAFVANSLIFLLIGLGNAAIPFRKLGWEALVTAICLVWASRAASVYPLCAIFSHSSLKIERNHQHALFWGGLRGALALALALSLSKEVPYREQIMIATFSVVVFSIVVQGIAMPLWLRHWGIGKSATDAS